MIKLNLRLLQRLPAKEKRITLSTMFTLMRMALIPFIVGAMMMERWGIACALFMGATLTDMLDGNIARWRKEQTFLGACLDPLADKLLILSSFFTLAFVESPLLAIPKWFFTVLCIKEMVLVAGAIVIYRIKGHIEIRPMLLGKITTVVQMMFIIWLFSCYFFSWIPLQTYYLLLGIMLFLIVISFIQYTVMGIRWLYEDR